MKIALIQLEQKQLDALMEFAKTRSVSLAVDIVDSIIENYCKDLDRYVSFIKNSIMDDLGISDNRKANND